MRHNNNNTAAEEWRKIRGFPLSCPHRAKTIAFFMRLVTSPPFGIIPETFLSLTREKHGMHVTVFFRSRRTGFVSSLPTSREGFRKPQQSSTRVFFKVVRSRAVYSNSDDRILCHRSFSTTKATNREAERERLHR